MPIHRSLSASLVVLAACVRGSETAPHGAGVAREALSDSGFVWQTEITASTHLHYLANTYAAGHIGEFAIAAEEAVGHDLKLMGLASAPAVIELFLVRTREDAIRLTGNRYMGQAIPGELTAFFVVQPGGVPLFRHEIMHALTLSIWGVRPVGTWLAEGVATWATEGCQGKNLAALAAGFMKRDSLPDLPTLAKRFWQIDEVHSYMTAGSVVEYLASTQGNAAVEALWKQKPDSLQHPLGRGGGEIEKTWRKHVAEIEAAQLDLVRLGRVGCS